MYILNLVMNGRYPVMHILQLIFFTNIIFFIFYDFCLICFIKTMQCFLWLFMCDMKINSIADKTRIMSIDRNLHNPHE